MSKEANIAVVRRFMEAYSKGDASAIKAVDEVTTSDFVHHAPYGDFDREAMKRSISNRPFPDEVIRIEDIVADGDKVAIRTTIQGTHKRQLGNIPPAGEKVKFTEFVIFRLNDGKITEDWSLANALAMYQALGALPPSSEIGKKQ